MLMTSETRRTRQPSACESWARRALSAAIIVTCAALPATGWAAPIGSATAHEALARCRAADGLVGEEREQLLREAMLLAERAVSLDDADAAAHFALFCALGESLRENGLGLSMLRDVRHLQHEIDLAIELAPGDPELWAAKGAMLLSLPSFLGGDRDEAQHLLVRAFVASPDNRATRAYLEEALE
jgi:hypothetical protein